MLEIKENEIHLWIVHDERIVDRSLLETYRTLLDAEESARHERFRFPQHRHHYLVTRALVRCVLSMYVEAVAPREWRFEKNRYGKPFIQNAMSVPLYFNLSHTEQMIVLAIAKDPDIGVDVERPRALSEMMNIASCHFSRVEVRQLLRLGGDRQRDRFFDLWTLKEAYIKACGEGLSVPLKHVRYLFSDNGASRLRFDPARDDHPAHWQFWRVVPNRTHKIAIAYRNQLLRTPGSLVVREIVPLRGFKRTLVPALRGMPSCKAGPAAADC